MTLMVSRKEDYVTVSSYSEDGTRRDGVRGDTLPLHHQAWSDVSLSWVYFVHLEIISIPISNVKYDYKDEELTISLWLFW